MDFKTLHEDWKTLVPGPFTDPENEVGYQEFLKIKEQGDIHHHHYAKGDNPDDKKKREKDAKAKAKEGEAKASDAGEAKPNGNGEEKKKLDPVGKEDGDIDNDGDQDKSDKYLAKKRKAIGKSIKAQKKTKNEKPIKLSGEKEKVELHKGSEEQKEEVKLDEVAVRGKLRDLSQELAAYARKHRSSVDKQYFEKISQIAAAGKMPSAKDIDTDTEPRDFVLSMMAKSFPKEVMNNFKGVSPALDHALRKDPMKQDKSLEQRRNKGGLFYARHGEEVEHDVEEASTYRDSKKAEDNKKVKKFAFGKKKERRIAGVYHSGYSKEETELGEGHEKEIANFMDKAFQGVDYHFKQGALHVAKGFRGKVARRMAGEGIKPPIKGITEEGLEEISKELKVRAYTKAGEKALSAQARRVKGDLSAGKEVLKRTDQRSKFYRAIFDKKNKKEEVEIDELEEAKFVKPVFSGKEKANIKRTLGFSFADKVKKYNKKLQKTKDSINKYKTEESEWAKSKRKDKEMEDKYEKIHQERDKRYKARQKEKKEETEVDEMSAIQKTSLNIHNQRVKLGIVKPGTKKIKKKESGVQKAASRAGMSSAERSYLYNDSSELPEGWKKGKHKITDDKGKIVSIHSSGAKAEREQQKLMQTGDHKKLTVAQVGHKSIWKNEEAELDEAPSNYEDEIKKFKAGGGKVKKLKPGKKFKSFFKGKALPRQEEAEIDEMSKKLLYRAASKAEVQGREPRSTGANYSMKSPEIRKKRRGQAVKFVKGIAKATEEVNTGNNRLGALEKEIDKLHGRTKHMKYLKGKDRDQMRDLSRKRDKLLKSRSIQGQFEEVELDELVAPGKKSASGYILYHKTFSDAMQHAVDHAKTKGATVDPKEIDDKVATGPRKPSNGKTNRYSLSAGRKTVQIQVANLDNKAYELNMYIEEVQTEEDIKSRISNSPLVNKLYLMNQAKAIGKERAGPDKEHKISAWEDLAKKMGFSRRDYEEFGDNQGMYESIIPQEKGDMATKTRLKLEKVLGNRKKIVEPKESERAGEWGTDKLSDNYKEATPGQTQEGITGDPKANEKALAKNRAMAKKYGQVRQGIAPEKEVKEGNVIVNDRDPYRVFEHLVHYLMGTSIKNIEDYSFYRIDETPHNLRLENKEGALATITLADVQSAYDDQDMSMDEFVEMMEGFGVKELTEKGNSIIGDEGVPAIGKDKTGQGIYTTDPPKTFENIDIYSKFIQSSEERQKKGFVVN